MGSRAASLLAASGMAVGMLALAACLTGFRLSSYTNRPDASAVLTVVRVARPEHVVPDGHQHPIVGAVPTAFAEETDTKDGLPANAVLLTALLFGSFFGAIPWGLNSASSALAGPRLTRPASCRVYPILCFFQRRSPCTLSGIFRL